jgi:hypothetical protein
MCNPRLYKGANSSIVEELSFIEGAYPPPNNGILFYSSMQR